MSSAKKRLSATTRRHRAGAPPFRFDPDQPRFELFEQEPGLAMIWVNAEKLLPWFDVAEFATSCR
jgi:hypothetical protein